MDDGPGVTTRARVVRASARQAGRWGAPARLVALLASSILPACQCVALENAMFRCGAESDCPAGRRCAVDPEPEAGFCVSWSEDGGALPDAGTLPDGGTGPGRVVDLVFANADGGSLDAFPVLVALDAKVIDYDAVPEPNTDLRFHDPDTDQDLPFQVETWNPAGESLVWVLVPNIGAGRADDFITLTWGAGAGGQADPSGWSVFGAYTGVWHLGAGGLANSASAQHAGTLTGGSADKGHLGSATRFSGSGDQRVTFAGATTFFDGWGPFTLELWLRPDYGSYSAITTEGGVLEKGGSMNLGRVFRTGTAPNQALLFQVDMHFVASPNDAYLNVEVPLQQWTWVVYTFDGKVLSVHRNGVEDGRETFLTTTTLRPGVQPFYLGGISTPINGALDEVRISRAGRGPDWIRAQYLSMTRRFITFRPR